MLFSLKCQLLPWVISSLIPQAHTSADLLDSFLKEEDILAFQARETNKNNFYFGKTKVLTYI